MRIIRTVLFALLLVCPSHAATQKDIQSLTIELAPTASDAVVPISIWVHFGAKLDSQIVGTGFLIDKKGDFITAGHVVDELERTKKLPNVTQVSMSAVLRQQNGNGSGQEFTITDRDNDHDLVLCHLPGVNAVTFEKSHMPKNLGHNGSLRFASLAISTATPQTGRFVLVSGFPLGSWTPAIQIGMIAATQTIYPNGMYGPIHKNWGDLLQISVSANHGNSGGPVIDLNSGQVIGVIDQLVRPPCNLRESKSSIRTRSPRLASCSHLRQSGSKPCLRRITSRAKRFQPGNWWPGNCPCPSQMSISSAPTSPGGHERLYESMIESGNADLTCGFGRVTYFSCHMSVACRTSSRTRIP